MSEERFGKVILRHKSRLGGFILSRRRRPDGAVWQLSSWRNR